MSFTIFCVGIVVILLTGMVTGGLGLLSTSGTDDFTFGAWVSSSIFLGICITYLLYINGVIQ